MSSHESVYELVQTTLVSLLHVLQQGGNVGKEITWIMVEFSITGHKCKC